jgi:hypothetical protein
VLYLIGGAPRAGKSILARRMLEQHKVAYFPTDLLMMGLTKAMPHLSLEPNDSPSTRAPIMWPILRGMAVTVLEDGVDYLIEGDVLMPAHVIELRERFGAAVHACFLGYATVDSVAKLHNIRRHGAGKQDWTNDCDDTHLLRIIEEFKSLSEHLRIECSASGLAYFDGSGDLFAAIDQAVVYLRS